jgi:hypothetical protein
MQKSSYQPCRVFGRLALLSIVALTSLPAHAQTAASAPSNQPSAEQAGSSAPGENGEDSPERALPPGHPPIDASQQGDASGLMPGGQLTRDTVNHSSSVPVGALEIHVLDADNHPVAGATVVVQLHRESVAEGNTEGKREAVADGNGVARVDHLLTDAAVSYRVKVSEAGVSYGMPPFQLNEHAGTIVTIHKYPIARDLKQALVAMQGLVFIEPRDDVFQFEVVYDLFNIGRTTWVPDRVEMRLPSRWKAFNSQQTGEDVRVEATTDGMRLVGAVAPGQHQVSYTFQVPRQNSANATFELELPPNVMASKVGLASNRNAELSVDGFPDPETTTSEKGQRLLITSKTFDRSTQMPTDLRVEVRGLPTLGSGRIVAAVIAFLLAAAGLVFALARRGRGQAGSEAEALQERDRQRLIEELSELEAAKAAGRIGPKTYEETRTTLVEALVRLEPIAH